MYHRQLENKYRQNKIEAGRTEKQEAPLFI